LVKYRQSFGYSSLKPVILWFEGFEFYQRLVPIFFQFPIFQTHTIFHQFFQKLPSLIYMFASLSLHSSPSSSIKPPIHDIQPPPNSPHHCTLPPKSTLPNTQAPQTQKLFTKENKMNRYKSTYQAISEMCNGPERFYS
jgi:hypothetical protein